MAQLRMLARRGYRGATLHDALTAPKGPRTVAVTFDDAHRSVLELARPVLDEVGFPATVFVPTDYAGTGAPMAWEGYDRWLGTEHEPELRCLPWDDLLALQESGWEIGSHTCSHPHLTRLTDEELERELVESRHVCEARTGRPCVSFAYPYSDHDDRTVEATRRGGYGLAVTVGHGWEAPLPLRWPRVGVFHGNSPRRVQGRVLRARRPLFDVGARELLRVARSARSALGR
jgi:peptidoglycan/xylan/chitin deacetylase (PgdA/CDA1 family)